MSIKPLKIYTTHVPTIREIGTLRAITQPLEEIELSISHLSIILRGETKERINPSNILLHHQFKKTPPNGRGFRIKEKDIQKQALVLFSGIYGASPVEFGFWITAKLLNC